MNDVGLVQREVEAETIAALRGATSNSTPAVIRTNGLVKRYGPIRALSDVSLEIPPGGITAIVGPNGAGKSTLLKLCIGFERPTAGTIEVLGVDPTQDRDRAVAAIGYVPQSPSLYRDLSVREHLHLAEAIRPGFDVAFASSRLAALGIPVARRPPELSGGQQAQVGLAMALGTHAELLLLDEPLASLDPLARREFLHVLAAAVEDTGVTAVLSSHALSEIEDVAGRILVLGDGSILFHDTVRSSVERHRVIAGGDDREIPGLVSSFPGRGRTADSLLRTDDRTIGHPASLEEVVLGYLALGQAHDTEESDPTFDPAP